MTADVEKFLQAHRIEYVLHEHQAVFTCEEAEKYCGDIPGLACKNLLLRDRKKRQYFLLILRAEDRADLDKIGRVAGKNKVSFASPKDLEAKMGLTPGAVSPFGLLNDAKHEIEVYIDERVYNADVLSFHPNINTASLELTGKMFRQYLRVIKNKVHVMK